MMQQFHVGDRVQTTRPFHDLPVGVSGVVFQIFRGGAFYDVRFYGELLPRRIHQSLLEPIAVSELAREVGGA
jgi:hypothetical protein